MSRQQARKKDKSQGIGSGTRSSSPARQHQGRTDETRLSPVRSAETGGPGGFSRRDALATLVLGLLIAVCYFPVLSAGFVWDDVVFTEDPLIHQMSGLSNIWFAPADIKQEGHYWPLVYTSFWLEHKLWGLAPLGYHLVNVLLHVVNCVLVWRLLQRLAVPGAWVIAAVFAVHPLHVESVAWVIERKDLLSALFYLTAVLTWIRFVETPGWRRYGLALALFTAGLLSKSVVVTLPAALLIWHWWQQGRITATDLLRLVPFFLVGLGITMADLAFYASREPLTLGYSWIERVLIAAHALWFYVGKLLWPTELAVIYPLWDIRVGEPLAWAYVVAALAVAALLWFGRHRMGRGALAGALFFTVTLSPVLGFVDYGYMQFSFVADRFQYLAGLGVLTILIGGGVHGAHKLPDGWKRGVTGLFVAVLALLGTLTWQQASMYRDEITFFSHVVSLNPAGRSAHHNLGKALIKAGRPEEGLAASRIAVRQRPDFADAYVNLGLALLKLDRSKEAEEHFVRALALDPRHADARHNVANVQRAREQYMEAVESYRAVIEIDSRHALAYAGLGDALFHLHRYGEAIQALTRALSLQPDLPEAGALHGTMGLAAQKLGQSKVAAGYFKRALEIHPRDAIALDQLAKLRFGQQRYEEALGLYQKLVEVNPDHAQHHANLGVTLYHLDRPDDALRSFERALALNPDLAMANTGLEEVRNILRPRGP